MVRYQADDELEIIPGESRRSFLRGAPQVWFGAARLFIKESFTSTPTSEPASQ